MQVAETLLSEVERYVLKTAYSVAGCAMVHGLSFPEGKELDTASALAKRGFLEEHYGYFAITDAGLSQLRSNSQ